jgi:fructose-bisphosphate aldolase class 1
VILYDETPFPRLLAARGLIPGIKVDTGAKPLAGAEGESVAEGLDGLRERLVEYRALGARFAKWRAVLAIGDGTTPWQLSFSYGRALQATPLTLWSSTCSQKPSPTRSRRRSSTNQSTMRASPDVTGAPSPPMSRLAPTCVT